MLCMVDMKLLDKCSSHSVRAAKLDNDDEGIFSSILWDTSNLRNIGEKKQVLSLLKKNFFNSWNFLTIFLNINQVSGYLFIVS